MRTKDALGRFGEDIAVGHLVEAGLQVLDRNWRCPAGEIDIVARDGDVVVFCEVKTRTSDAFGTPAEAVGAVKRRRIRALACQWLSARRRLGGDAPVPGIDLSGDADLRFDVLSVRCRGRGDATVEHLRGAF